MMIRNRLRLMLVKAVTITIISAGEIGETILKMNKFSKCLLSNLRSYLKKILTLVILGSTVTSLVACSQPQKPRHSAKKRPLITMQSDSEPTQDPKVRLQFNDIKTATVQDNFQNGTTLEQIKSFYGELM